MENINNKIDNLLQIRQDSMVNYAKSTKELIDIGVKIKNKETDDITLPISFEQYLDQYNVSSLEFEWEVMYKDGTILKQFNGKVETLFNQINQEQLKSVSFISNFNWPSEAGKNPRIIAKLNWETGLFEFTNGFVPQEVRAEVCMNPLAGNKKLIIVTRKSFKFSKGEIDDRYKEFFPFFDELFYFNRFILGYEVPNVGKKTIIISPNGTILNFKN